MDKYHKAWITGLFFVVLVMGALLIWACAAMAADLNLAWDPSVGATGYRVQISTTQGVSWGETRDAGPQTTFAWTGAPDSGLVLFRVMAYNAQGESINFVKGAWYNGSWTPPVTAAGLGLK